MLRPILLSAFVAFAASPPALLAQDAKKCSLQKVVEWNVRSIGRHMAVDGAINGKKIGIVLDTGAYASLLFRASAKRLGLDLKVARGERAYGAVGETQVYTALVDEFKLGEAAVRSLNVYVTGEDDRGEGFDLLLGQDFLTHFDIEFDLASDKVRLWQPKDCGDRSLAYWTKDVVGEVPLEPTTDTQRNIAFTARLNGKPVHAILSSGASTTIVNKHDAEAVGAVSAEAKVGASGPGANAVDGWVGKFASFAIGNEEIPDVEIRVGDTYQSATYIGLGHVSLSLYYAQPMLLGADFLRAHRTYVSHAQRKMYFTYTGGPVFVTGRKAP